MPVNWPFAHDLLKLGGADKKRIQPDDAERQTQTAQAILADLTDRPGVLLADEVGTGKTYVALATAASVIQATQGKQGPVVIMVPSRLRGKWQREWQQFKRHCAGNSKLDWIRDVNAHTPTEFFKLLDDDASHRKHLVFITTGCFTSHLSDPWIRLALIRLARTHTKLSGEQKRRIYRWATNLVRLVSHRKLTEDVVRKLLNSDLDRWKEVLVREGLLDDEDDDPIPKLLPKYAARIDNWRPLVDVIRDSLPKRASASLDERLKSARQEFNLACRAIYQEWLTCSNWHSPLLILDEAHHAKNDDTRLARLFRQSSSDDVSLLAGKFQRMLFLTATPFQLGHQELIRVLESFAAVRWNGTGSPSLSQEEFAAKIKRLEQALDDNRLAGRHLDRLWGDIRLESLGEQDAATWWQRVETSPADEWEKRLVAAVDRCRQTRKTAEELLKPWLIRHNRPTQLPAVMGRASQSRREGISGRGIVGESHLWQGRELGLPIAKEAALPFLLTARAQGELALVSGARAFFAEGLASSYEAFHYTRKNRGKTNHSADEGGSAVRAAEEAGTRSTVVPTAWYEEQVARLIPSRSAEPDERLLRLQHPKIKATVARAVDLWAGGEKVLVFCFYRETCKSLYEHLRAEVQTRTLKIAQEKLGGEYAQDDAKVQDFLARIARRFSEPDRPFYREVRQILSRPFDEQRYRWLRENGKEKALVDVLAAYFRAPSFLARYLPLDDPAVQRALELGEGRREILEPGLAALRHGILEHVDQSHQTYLDRVYQFLDFAVELAERAQVRLDEGDEEDDESDDPLEMCLRAVSVYAQPRRFEDEERDEIPSDADDDGSYRVVPLVRLVHGDMKPETRERLALAFNSPLFPEILVSSSVMGEGIDLHRFCRHVIHHDGYWNPSTLEQQTGRIDRIRCKAEICGMPIKVYQPFLAGSADEKMFRVVRDRERWFQIVMGQKFEFDEGMSEAIAARVPLPEGIARELTFDLARWKPAPVSEPVG